MKRKVSQMMEHLTEEILENVPEAEVNKEMANRIKVCALQAAQQTYTLEEQGKKKKVSTRGKRKVWQRIFIIAATVGTLMGTAVAAISGNNTLRELFGDKVSAITGNIQEISQSVTQNGVTMTVETAVADNSGGLIVIHFTKDDGSVFEEQSELRRFDVIVGGGEIIEEQQGWQLSEDKKKLTYIVKLQGDLEIVGKEVTIIAEDIASVTPKDKTLNLNLANSLKEPYDLEYPYSDMAIKEIECTENGLYIEIQYTYKEDDIRKIYRLVDSRNGLSIRHSGWSSGSSSGTKVREASILYKSILPEDLQYIDMIKMYNDYEIFVPGTWKIDFVLEENKDVKRNNKNVKIKIDQATIEVSDIELSSVGGSIKGKLYYQWDEDYMEHRGLEPGTSFKLSDLGAVLYKKNGTTTQMQMKTGKFGNNGDSYYAHFEVGMPEGASVDEKGKYSGGKEKRYLEEDEYQYFGMEEIDNLYRKENAIEKILSSQFIDVEQVKAIEIEGVKIPLK